jgi:cytochrome c oxidase subunit 3
MLFSGLFMAYLIGRLTHPTAFADGSAELNHVLGTVNTAILLTSSFTMALAVNHAEEKNYGTSSWLLLLTSLLGAVFLGIKVFEWVEEYRHARVPGIHFVYEGEHLQGMLLFYWFYFTSTALHAVHLTIGLASNLWFALVARFKPQWIPDPSPLVLGGIYWHLVDLVWIFLYPLLYLIGGPK